jgi:hypothetical protein
MIVIFDDFLLDLDKIIYFGYKEEYLFWTTDNIQTNKEDMEHPLLAEYVYEKIVTVLVNPPENKVISFQEEIKQLRKKVRNQVEKEKELKEYSSGLEGSLSITEPREGKIVSY